MRFLLLLLNCTQLYLFSVQDDQLFLSEINIMRRLSHPNIIRYLGCGMIMEGNHAYMAIVRTWPLCVCAAPNVLRSKTLRSYVVEQQRESCTAL